MAKVVIVSAELVTILLISVGCLVLGAKISEEPATSVHHVEAVVGQMAKLPCDIRPTVANDRITIVIWFMELKNRSDGNIKRKNPVPIYSLDARDDSQESPVEWIDEKLLGKRVVFMRNENPAILMFNLVERDDENIYYCRADFKHTPTRNIKVNLTVTIPPEKVMIIDVNDSHIKDYKLGPFNEGTSVNITCEATGGVPVPNVTWWLENTLLDKSMDYITIHSDDPYHFWHNITKMKVRNVLHIDKIERKSLNAVYTCQATNSQLMHPISSSITLDVNLKPLWMRLRGNNKPLSATKSYKLECEVVGSRPEPIITWWKATAQMKNTQEVTSPDGNTTTSILTFTPTVDDDGKYMSCHGQHPIIQDSGIENGWKLNIYHKPLVTLELGSTLNGSTIKEGVDVYFECNIKSNPWVYKVSWRHNGKQLFNNVAGGTIVSNQSLVLQSITTARTGHYTCVGHNQEGDGESNSVQLDVKYAPVCRPEQVRIFGVAREEVAQITCEVEANPNDVDFTWKFNNSADTFEIAQTQIYSVKDRSTAKFKPITEQDYGTLLCWGRNEIGMQKEPCVYYITPAGKPDALSNCSITNQTSDAIYIECSEGFDGGLPQMFVMEVYESRDGKLVSNMTCRIPVFIVTGLESGAGFDIALYAANKKGNSSVVHLSAFTLKGAEKHTGSTPVLLHITPLLGGLIGVLAALGMVGIIVILVVKLRRRGHRDEKDFDDGGLSSAGRRCVAGSNSDKASTEPLNKDMNDSVDSLEEKNPDIIPQNNAEDEYQDEERAFERLNNAPSMRVYSRLQSPNQTNGSYGKAVTPGEITYAELSISNQQMPPHVIYNQHPPSVALNVIRRQEPTVYAQLDMKRIPQIMPHPGGFQTLHHPHMPAYLTRPIRDDHLLQDGSISSETPLLGTGSTLSSLKEMSGSRTPSVTSTLPRPVTATRF
ncbi:synaptogenesis protein syg-2 isoform X3 [Dendroctonus ponderosae]|uniref:Ig-like domain-containing protein n=1 Tax=Dendroctonus ponderosae TaxID=77166 RepID=A0AAR5PU09_DENPD|nr:synaptogenesis protein syg-2 isoform X3 [Dendroctonus ponderosae]